MSPSPPASVASSIHASPSTGSIQSQPKDGPSSLLSIPSSLSSLSSLAQPSQPSQPSHSSQQDHEQQQHQAQLPTPPMSRSTAVGPQGRTSLLPEMPSAADLLPLPFPAQSKKGKTGSKTGSKTGVDKLMSALDTTSIRSAAAAVSLDSNPIHNNNPGSSHSPSPSQSSSHAHHHHQGPQSSSTGSNNGHFIEAKLRFERFPQGGHRHALSAKRRHFFLATQESLMKKSEEEDCCHYKCRLSFYSFHSIHPIHPIHPNHPYHEKKKNA